ncbi:MAG: hypothetical protein ABIH69_00245 [bacterium]
MLPAEIPVGNPMLAEEKVIIQEDRYGSFQKARFTYLELVGSGLKE